MLKKTKTKNIPTNYKQLRSRKGGKTAIIRLLFRYYYKSFYGPFFNFIFPILLYTILSSFMEPRLVLPGILSMTTMSMGISGLPYSILELKQSVILKRIGASPVKKSDFTIATIIFFSIQLIFSMLSLMLFSLIRHLDPTIFDGLKNVGAAFGFIYGNLLNALLSIAFGFMIASLSKTANQANAIGMMIYFPAAFLSGQFIAMNILVTKPIMNYISYIFPFRYTTMIISVSFGGDYYFGNPFLYNQIQINQVGSFANVLETLRENGFTNEQLQNMTLLEIALQGLKLGMFPIPSDDPNEEFKFWVLGRQVIYDAWEVVMAYVYSYAIIIICLTISITKFTWSNRG